MILFIFIITAFNLSLCMNEARSKRTPGPILRQLMEANKTNSGQPQQHKHRESMNNEKNRTVRPISQQLTKTNTNQPHPPKQQINHPDDNEQDWDCYKR